MRRKLLTTLLISSTLGGFANRVIFASDDLSVCNTNISDVQTKGKSLDYNSNYNLSSDRFTHVDLPLKVIEEDGTIRNQKFTHAGFQTFLYNKENENYLYQGYGYVYEWDDSKFSVLTGLYDIEGKRYLANDKGVNLIGPNKFKGDIYFFNEDITNAYAKTGWQWSIRDRCWYYLGDDCKARTGFSLIDGNTYHFDNEGHLDSRPGFRNISGKLYYFNSDWTLANGWKTFSDGKRYFLNPAKGGAAEKGWYKLDPAGVMYFRNDGSMARGLNKIGEHYYLFQTNGNGENAYLKTGWFTDMHTVTRDRYYFNPSKGGQAETGWYKDDPAGAMYFYKNGTKEGVMAKGITQIEGKYYLFLPHGDGSNYYQALGWYSDLSTGKRYYFNPDPHSDGSALTSRWYEDGEGTGRWMYFTKDGSIAKGVTKIDEDYYVFTKDRGDTYYRAYGWYTDTSTHKRYYFEQSKDGKAIRNQLRNIDGKNYYFNNDGSVQY